jgi:hypothetical protein
LATQSALLRADADAGTQDLFSTSFYNAGDEEIDLTGLVHSQAYTLVLYDGGNGTNPVDVSVTGLSSTPYTSYIAASSFSIADGPGDAYAELNVVSSASGDLTIVESPDAAGGGYSGYNGFQLEAAPEPSTYALFAVAGMILLIGRNWRRSQSL